MSQDQKQDLIIDAAIKRFAHFGVNKTTMNEIAGDLAISKALLYYYFPDKISLFAQVLRQISQQHRGEVENELAGVTDPQQALTIFLDKRTDFIIKYYNILQFLTSFKSGMLPKELQSLFATLKKHELDRITAIIDMGKNLQLYHIDSAAKTSALYYDFLEGYRYTSLTREQMLFPEKKQFLAILKKEKEFTTIFLKGLTK